MEKKKIKISEIRKQSSCCGPQTSSSCCPESEIKNAKFLPSTVAEVSTDWTWEDYLGQIRCRVTSYRNSYAATPGLYAVGAPDKESDVFVSANYKLSFDVLRSSLKGMNAWILVLDTKGINVWCAAGKGTFGTDELIKRILDVNLENVVSHKRIIVPQLGAPGVAAHIVKKETGFRVYYGPVHAKDILAYIAAGYYATKDMRTVRFTWLDRVVLTPMEIIPALKKFPVYALLVLLILGLQPSGIFFRDAGPFLLLGLLSVLSGAFITPLLLPLIPFRAFAVKGWIVGFISVLSVQGVLKITDKGLLIFTYLFFPILSSYIALQFTGSTAFTGMSGVKKELRYALPVYKAAAGASIIFLLISRLGDWGIL